MPPDVECSGTSPGDWACHDRGKALGRNERSPTALAGAWRRDHPMSKMR